MKNNYNKSKKIKIKTKTIEKGNISFFDNKLLHFTPKRIYYIYKNINKTRGGHANKKNISFYICLNGSCEIELSYNKKKKKIKLSNKNEGLIVHPGVKRIVKKLKRNTLLLSVCSMFYSKKDVI